MKNKFIYIAILTAGFAACEPEFENELSNSSYSAGDADFSSYVALGNSLTAGFMDGTVSRVSQQYSYPNLLAQQFALVGGGTFTQPSYAEDVNNTGGISGIPGFNTRLILDAGSQSPEPINQPSTITLAPQATAFNNMGVPGAKSFHLLAPGYGNPAGLQTNPLSANPYYVRHATSPNARIIDDAMAKNPTFFTNWIGSNDVLAYATSGGLGVNQLGNTNVASYGSNDITDPTAFAGVYSATINTLTANGAKGVVATIPNVTSIPFFTTVPYNPLTATVLGNGNVANGQAAIQQANVLYAQLRQILSFFGQANRISLWTLEGRNPLLIRDESLTNLSAQIRGALLASGLSDQQATFYGQTFGQARQANANDLVLLPTRAVIGTAPNGVPAPLNAFGISYPLQDEHVLTAAEIIQVNTATTAFNNSIRAIAESKGLAIADMNAILNQLVSGLRVEDGQIYTANYFSTSRINTTLFSLDGIHPNARGYAIITNEIIKVINRHYNARLPLVSAGNFPGATILPTN
ncbi:G-D-S-L family lipolytic protein [Flavobacterium cyanobacteriorum]|uniref:G-D-S-L family lipolytic protein n=1 Tax=Flavobacterium cyanobacteriorum TaxID=2022802 RepID=A0A255ZA14_9FLAO|nr:G-D-S-L family lipolytic protein [Flavobacterium cyanobacteriorum]OYQ37460.1 G-D-S-L family lipolytic protein [Flavobacterium cyanobacteriorum]